MYWRNHCKAITISNFLPHLLRLFSAFCDCLQLSTLIDKLQRSLTNPMFQRMIHPIGIFEVYRMFTLKV